MIMLAKKLISFSSEFNTYTPPVFVPVLEQVERRILHDLHRLNDSDQKNAHLSTQIPKFGQRWSPLAIENT